MKIVVLSGPIAVGKSSFAGELIARYGAAKVSTRQYILDTTKVDGNRAALQAAGDKLDADTGGKWVADAVAKFSANHTDKNTLLVDSARIPGQVKALRSRFGNDQVLHVHLTAPLHVLKKRFLERIQEVDDPATYEEAQANPTEAAVEKMSEGADAIVDTSKGDSASQVTLATAGRIGPSNAVGFVDVIVGGQYGSEGKGNICGFIAGDYDILVRIGGPNAGHRVADPPYKYVQLPSGTGANPKAVVVIAAGSTIWLPQLLMEIADHPRLLEPGNLVIDSQAMIIDDQDRRIEAELLEAIASTKQGVGSALARKIIGRGCVPPFGGPVALVRDVPQLSRFSGSARALLDNAYLAGKKILVEGTQGTDLSIYHGMYPSVTSRETSVAGCLSDAGIAPKKLRKVIMVTRTYPIRVGGTSGPMGVLTSFEAISDSSGVPLEEIQKTEIGTVSGRTRRIAEFDWEQLRRNAVLNGATEIALTFADYLGIGNRKATRFEDLNAHTLQFIADVERVAGCRVGLVSVKFAKDGVLKRKEAAE